MSTNISTITDDEALDLFRTGWNRCKPLERLYIFQHLQADSDHYARFCWELGIEFASEYVHPIFGPDEVPDEEEDRARYLCTEVFAVNLINNVLGVEL